MEAALSGKQQRQMVTQCPAHQMARSDVTRIGGLIILRSSEDETLRDWRWASYLEALCLQDPGVACGDGLLTCHRIWANIRLHLLQ